jgi:two-component system chemotaxis response regulator CheB
MSKKNRLLIIDDSRMMRNVISDIFSSNTDLDVMETASSGFEALKIIQSDPPDVITLDINMPEMDGLTTLKHLMIHTPTPTVMLSSLSRDGAKITFDALRYGAVDFITKPSNLDPYKMQEHADNMIHTVKCAASVKIDIMHYIRPYFDHNPTKDTLSYKFVVAMGAAEGGYSSLLNILPRLSLNNPLAYLVVLYANSHYIDSFITYLNQHSAITVKRAKQDDILQIGVCYICSGDEYMTVQDSGIDHTLHLHPVPFISQKSAINRLMFSLADVMDNRSIGIILSGAGNDGNEGIEEMTRMGGQIMIQNPKNCLYKGMSESVIKYCTIKSVSSTAEIAKKLNAYCL